MTDFHSMSDSELNEWIARRKYNKRPDMWLYPHDYCNDWKWAGELLEEMKEEGVVLEFTHDHDFTPPLSRWIVHFPNWNIKCRVIIVSRDCPTRAIAEAYAVMTNTVGDMTKEIGGEG